MIDSLVKSCGISLRALAVLTNTDHSILSRQLGGERSLPLKALVQMIELTKLADGLAAGDPQPSAEDLLEVQQTVVLLQAEVNMARRKLAKMQQRWQQANKLLQLADALALKTPTHTARQQRMVEEQRYKAKKIMAASGWLQQKQLQVNLAVLECQLEMYRAAASEQPLIIN